MAAVAAPARELDVDAGRPSRRNPCHAIRAIVDDRLRRVCAILIGMSALAVTVGAVTIMIHDRIQSSKNP